jgi:hypothetical protein
MTVSLSLTIRRGGGLSRGLKFGVYKNDTAGGPREDEWVVKVSG